jgi:hypothetical protein
MALHPIRIHEPLTAFANVMADKWECEDDGERAEDPKGSIQEKAQERESFCQGERCVARWGGLNLSSIAARIAGIGVPVVDDRRSPTTRSPFRLNAKNTLRVPSENE